MNRTSKFLNVFSSLSVLFVASLSAGLLGVGPVAAQSGDHIDQADVELLVWRIASGIRSEGDAFAFLGRDLLTDEFFRVRGNGEVGVTESEELTELPDIAPAIDEDDLRDFALTHLHVAIFSLTAIATATVVGEDQTFAIMCVETPAGWKIAALQTGGTG